MGIDVTGEDDGIEEVGTSDGILVGSSELGLKVGLVDGVEIVGKELGLVVGIIGVGFTEGNAGVGTSEGALVQHRRVCSILVSISQGPLGVSNSEQGRSSAAWFGK